MREERRALAAVAIPILLAAACQSGAGDSPPLPTSPPPTARVAPPEEVRLIRMGFRGPLFQPGVPLPLEPGIRLSVPVMTHVRDFGDADGIPGVLIRVETDAPPAVLTVSEQIAVKGWAEPGLVEVRAVETFSSGAPAATYQIWLEEHPEQVWAPGFALALDERRLLVAVTEASPPPAPCERLEVTGTVTSGVKDGGDRARLTFGSLADDFRSGTITLRADHPETSLSLVSEYRMPYEDLDPESDRARVTYRPYPTTFLFGLGFRETGVGFEQTMSLGWFDEFHLRAEAPGCDPVNLSCDETGRCSPGSPAP